MSFIKSVTCAFFLVESSTACTFEEAEKPRGFHMSLFGLIISFGFTISLRSLIKTFKK